MLTTVQTVIIIVLSEVLIWDILTKILKVIHMYIITKHGTENEFKELIWNEKETYQNEKKENDTERTS